MLNVSCQQQKHCSSLPANSPTESPMEFVGQPKASEACNFLGVPGLSSLDVDEDECEVVIGIRPKSSPLPRRKSSTSDEDFEPEPPLPGSRRVSFADAKGLSLVQVKKFETWDLPMLPVCDPSEVIGKVAEEYFLSPLTFSLPLPTAELFVKVQEQKVELETIELIPGTTILKGVIRVLNISFTKSVYVRATLDTWSSHFDLLAEYMPGSSYSLMDLFSFKLTLVPPFGEQGARVDFCLRYETPQGTFWANNNGRNYVLFCHQRMKEKPQKENVNKKSCLKIVSQSTSTVEYPTAMEASNQENISTAVLKQGRVADTIRVKQISDDQSGTSEEDRQKLLVESRHNCSRRSRRKAARTARVRDYFSQRDGGVDDTERDESPPEAKQAAQEETPEEKHSNVRSFTEGSSKSECSESVETGSAPLLDDTSPAHDYTSNSETAKFESVNLADSATLTGGESATDIPHNPSNDEPAPAENINMSKAEESNAAAEPTEVSSLVSQTNSFKFGTVVAPLYHQVFGRVGSESQNVSDWGNPGLNVADLTQSYLYTERRQTSCPFPRDARGNDEEVHRNAIKTQESNQEFLDATPNSPPKEEEEETSLSVTANDILDHAETVQDPVDIILSDQSRTDTSEVPNTISEDTVHPHAVHILNTDLLDLQIPDESLHLQGEAQENNLTHDLQLPEHSCTQTNLDETLAESDDMPSVETSLMPLQPSQSGSECVSDETDQQTSRSGANDFKCVHESDKGNGVGETVTLPTSNDLSEEDKLLAALHDLNPEHINNSAAEETENSYVSCFEIVEEKNVTTPQISLETNDMEEGYKVANDSYKGEAKHSAETKVTGEVAESTTKATISNHIHGNVFVELKDEDVQEKENHEMEAALSKDFCLADTTEVNWEMMVEEEEKNILTDEVESESVSVKTVEKDQGQLDDPGIELEDSGIETASENRDTTEKTEKEMLEITAERETENKAEDADVSEDKQRTADNDISEIMSEKDREEVEKELEYVQTTKTAGEEEPSEETEEEKRQEQEETELEEEKHFAVTPEINTQRLNVQDEEEIEEEEEMEINLSDDYDADVEWEDQLKTREENREEENPDYNEESLADVESESMTIEDGENEEGCFEERSDITQNKIEDASSAPLNNVQDKRVIDKENTGVGQNGHIPTVTHDLSRAEGNENDSAAAEGGSWIFTGEPESDQESHDSSSAESDSDDEVELYMHCLRAVHAGAQAQKDRNKDRGFNVAKRPSISRGKPLSTPMPPISESLDEEQHFSCLLDNHEDMEIAEIQLTAADSGEQESINRNVAWWRETFSCSNISKTLLYATLLVVFFVVAHRYDFLACFGLYLVSVVWLYCQGDRQPGQQKQQNKLN
ncbi:uncharacterized protein ppp1r3ab [Epinephelus fuscoguttatus]|uniref:uncharacterized protein ppp1r3ab n=1 Tax=Epinephelus fuscoguttatus TaxID=293821 RepID=UPI0020D103D7|nr:uncharacterized protein ppp1r3ab [Epinephelus fuscoguttatus]